MNGTAAEGIGPPWGLTSSSFCHVTVYRTRLLITDDLKLETDTVAVQPHKVA